LYDLKHAITAADMLNDRVLPFFEEHGVLLLRILTDRSSEYCGNRESHEFALYLDFANIEHTRTKTESPQTNSICERFHQTIQNDFYASAFRRKLYHSLEELQADVDAWMRGYNAERTRSGKSCYDVHRERNPGLRYTARSHFNQHRHQLTWSPKAACLSDQVSTRTNHLPVAPPSAQVVSAFGNHLLCSSGAIPIAQRPHAVVIGDHPLILPFYDRANVGWKVLLQRFPILRLCIILAALAFFQYRLVLAAGYRFL
jgi:hypothetical protein